MTSEMANSTAKTTLMILMVTGHLKESRTLIVRPRPGASPVSLVRRLLMRYPFTSSSWSRSNASQRPPNT